MLDSPYGVEVTGKGFADIVMVPHRNVDAPAIVVELKYSKSADTAISQIKKQQYTASIKDYSGTILLVGINYDKKSKHHTYIIEKWGKK